MVPSADPSHPAGPGASPVPPSSPEEAVRQVIAGLEAVVFDLDDTLIDWKATEQAAMEAVHREHLGHHPYDRVHTVYADVKKANMKSFLATGQWWYAPDRLSRLLADLEEAADVDALTDTFSRTVRERLALLPGCIDVLTEARRGRRTAILTNGPASVQRAKVDALDVSRLVDHVAIAGEMDLWKPDPKAFHAVLERLAVAPRQALMVGDSMHFDIEPARALGMRTCWVGGDDPSRADLVLPSVVFLAPHLAASVH